MHNEVFHWYNNILFVNNFVLGSHENDNLVQCQQHMLLLGLYNLNCYCLFDVLVIDSSQPTQMLRKACAPLSTIRSIQTRHFFPTRAVHIDILHHILLTVFFSPFCIILRKACINEYLYDNVLLAYFLLQNSEDLLNGQKFSFWVLLGLDYQIACFRLPMT